MIILDRIVCCGSWLTAIFTRIGLLYKFVSSKGLEYNAEMTKL